MYVHSCFGLGFFLEKECAICIMDVILARQSDLSLLVFLALLVSDEIY